MFKWLKPKRIKRDDPVFGRLVYDNRLVQWKTEEKMPFSPTASRVLITIESDLEGPSDCHRQMFKDLEKRYSELSLTIANELFHRYNPTQEYERQGMPYPRSSDEMWSMVQLDIVFLTKRSVELVYAFIPQMGWDDAMLTVTIMEGRVVGSTFGD